MILFCNQNIAADMMTQLNKRKQSIFSYLALPSRLCQFFIAYIVDLKEIITPISPSYCLNYRTDAVKEQSCNSP